MAKKRITQMNTHSLQFSILDILTVQISTVELADASERAVSNFNRFVRLAFRLELCMKLRLQLASLNSDRLKFFKIEYHFAHLQ